MLKVISRELTFHTVCMSPAVIVTPIKSGSRRNAFVPADIQRYTILLYTEKTGLSTVFLNSAALSLEIVHHLQR